ncbi:MAG: 2,3-bisphosphoglycerate-independent phosphoglycerate mutase, partial [Clostridiales bacterium]|nr:2,3-bisphosphoglycerate-independent phosphoglycerate mutase [Clostridiales bacterium]
AVGLPDDGDMGNSEVGHNALGCGQIYAQGAKLVNHSIESGELFKSATWRGLVQNAAENGGKLHFIGLLSDGNVHSNIEHLIAMVRRAKNEGLPKVRIHGLLDGRDVAAQSALEFISKLELLFAELNDENFDARIATGGGRQVITMDRYGANWGMVEQGWNVHIRGIGPQFGSASEAIIAARAESPNIIDQDLPPFVIAESGAPVGKIEDGDSVVLFNFRGDRAIELSQAFDLPDFKHFERGERPQVYFAGMLQYDGDLHLPEKFLVNPPHIVNTLTDTLVDHGVHQFAVSETQKFGHMTYFWNGNRTEKVAEALEDWVEILSDILPFEQRPWMKAAEITDQVIAAIKSRRYGFIRANMPNGDMVGHTGSFQAAQIAVSAVDLCLGRLIEAARAGGVTLIVTADHGNADEMLEADGKTPKTAHSLNPAPFIIFDEGREFKFKAGEFGLANVAATIAEILGIAPHPAWEESMLCK